MAKPACDHPRDAKNSEAKALITANPTPCSERLSPLRQIVPSTHVMGTRSPLGATAAGTRAPIPHASNDVTMINDIAIEKPKCRYMSMPMGAPSATDMYIAMPVNDIALPAFCEPPVAIIQVT